MIADDAVEGQDGRRKHHGGYVDGNERAPARPSCRRHAVGQESDSPHSERERQVRAVAAEPVGDRRTVGDHEGVRGTRIVAAGNRPAAAHDGREEKRRKERCTEGERPSREQQPLRRGAKPSLGEGEDDVVGEDERREVTEHTDAVEQGIGRPLQRHDDRRKRQRHEREAEAIAGTSNQPVERRAGPSHDDHGPLDAVRNRIDEVVARREQQTRSDRDENPSDRSGDQDAASSEDRRDGSAAEASCRPLADGVDTQPFEFVRRGYLARTPPPVQPTPKPRRSDTRSSAPRLDPRDIGGRPLHPGERADGGVMTPAGGDTGSRNE